MFDSITYPRRDIGRDASQHLPADNINVNKNNTSSEQRCQYAVGQEEHIKYGKYPPSELPDWSLPSSRRLEGLRREGKDTSVPTSKKHVSQLLQKKFPPIQACVPGLLPEGLAILAGKPKSGKSLLALHLALSVATGQPFLDHFPTEKGWVQYFCLEDGERRLQERLNALGADESMPLCYSTSLEPGVPLEDLIIRSTQIAEGVIAPFRLFIVDTMGRAFSGKNMDYNDYGSMYNLLPSLNDLAQDLHVTILLIHHTRKQESFDPFDSILGSQAIYGSCETVLVLQRDRFNEEARLSISGRNVEEQELVIVKDGAQWKYVGPAQQVPETGLERQIFMVLKNSPRPLRTKEVWERVKETCDVEESTVSKKLGKLQKQRLVVSPNYGVWQVP